MTTYVDRRFSRRLDWHQAPNALAAAESARRRSGLPVRDLTESNPTVVDLNNEGTTAGSGVRYEEDDSGLAALAAAFMRALHLPYEPSPRGLPSARAAVAETYSRVGSKIHPDAVVLTASSSESYGFLWKLLCDPGDTVLVPEPSYPLFEYLARLDGITTLPYQLAHDGTRSGRWHLDLGSVDDALARARSPVRAIVVVSPNNPTGSLVDKAELAALDQRATAHGFSLIADEVFCEYVAEPRPQQVRCVAAEQTQSLAFSLGGLSKSCGLPQLKVGWIAVGGPPELVRTVLDRLDLIADTYLSVATPVQAALPELLRHGTQRRRSIQARVADNRATLDEIFAPPSAASVLSAEGGWSAILRLPAIMSDEAWALGFLSGDGVLVHPGYFFDLRAFTCVVVSLLPPGPVFRAGATAISRRIAEHLSR